MVALQQSGANHRLADIARGQAQGAQAGNHDVGKVLAHALALRQGL